MNFTFALPPTSNKIWRVRKGYLPYKSSEYTEWRDTAAKEILYQRHGEQYTGPVEISIAIRRNHGSSDLDNRIKPILDALQQGGAVKNDNLVHRIEAWWEPSLGDGLVWVSISNLRASISERRVA